MSGRTTFASGATTLVLLVAAFPPAAAVVPPAGFVVENAVPSTGFNLPTAFAFTPDGRVLVAEKRGVVRVVERGVKLVQPMWSGEAEVLSNGDRGLIGIAVDPGFAVNGFVYLLYTVDPDSNGVENDDDAFGRLTRYRIDPSNVNQLDPTTRTVLLGRGWADGFPSGSLSHSVGALRFGEDGSLMVSCGDGANYAGVDSGGLDPGLFAPGRVDAAQDLGAFRSQSLSSMNGKILRIDPATGLGYPSNPHFDGDPGSVRSRVWARGLRNPFRFCVRPGTGAADPAVGRPGTVVAGDVGWMNEEEVDVLRPGDNGGWPCWEGTSGVPGYQAVRTVRPNCCDLAWPRVGAYPVLEGLGSRRCAPAIAYHQVDTARCTVPGLLGRCVIGGVFASGASYPLVYRGRYFFGDFIAGWIRAAAFDANHELTDVVDFATDAEGPVDFGVDPATGELYYLALQTGRLYRVRYTGPVDLESPRSRWSVSAAWPNPAGESVRFAVEIARESRVGISIFDAQGRAVFCDPSRPRRPGRVWLAWNGRNTAGKPLPAGVYFGRVEVGESAVTKTIVLAR